MTALRARILLIAMFVVACTSNPPLDVAPVDLNRFQGKWYEIAKLPRTTENGCEGTTAFYRLKSATELSITNECRQGSGTRSVSASALVSDPDVPGKLSLDIGGFYGDYWIVDVGQNYEFAVIGHPTREYLWILSRTPTLPAATTTGILARAQAKHFDVSRLEYTVQP